VHCDSSKSAKTAMLRTAVASTRGDASGASVSVR
jgi:hypothetical protein